MSISPDCSAVKRPWPSAVCTVLYLHRRNRSCCSTTDININTSTCPCHRYRQTRYTGVDTALDEAFFLTASSVAPANAVAEIEVNNATAEVNANIFSLVRFPLVCLLSFQRSQVLQWQTDQTGCTSEQSMEACMSIPFVRCVFPPLFLMIFLVVQISRSLNSDIRKQYP